MRRPTYARVQRLQQARRRWLREQGAAWCEHNPSTIDEAQSVYDETPLETRAALESLSTEQLEVLCAPDVKPSDLPELTDAQLRALFWPIDVED